MHDITPWLWFDTQAEEAAEFYTSVFPNSRIVDVSRYGEAGPRPAGMAMTVTSLHVHGGRVVHGHLRRPGRGGQVLEHPLRRREEQPCGWLKDRYGLSWQIIPSALPRLLGDPDPVRAQRAMAAMLKMKKIVVADLEAAADAA